MAKPNYQYEKRQRELAKKAKKAEKVARKAQGHSDEASDAVQLEGVQANQPDGATFTEVGVPPVGSDH